MQRVLLHTLKNVGELSPRFNFLDLCRPNRVAWHQDVLRRIVKAIVSARAISWLVN